MPISPTAPMPLHNQPTLHIIGNPAGNISGNTSGNIVHLLTLRSLSHNNLATLHPIGKTGNISGNKIGNNSGNTACIITMARTASATAPIPEKFTTRANQTSPSATPAAPPAMIPAIESATIPATSAPTYRHPIRPTTVYLRGLRGTRWRDFNRPPYAGNISGKDSGNASANHPHYSRPMSPSPPASHESKTKISAYSMATSPPLRNSTQRTWHKRPFDVHLRGAGKHPSRHMSNITYASS